MLIFKDFPYPENSKIPVSRISKNSGHPGRYIEFAAQDQLKL